MKGLNYFNLKLFLTFFLIFVVLQGLNAIELQDLDNLPRTPDELAENSLNYFKNSWSNFASNNTITKPIHNFFNNNQDIFLFLFNLNYEFSLTFICVIFLWFFFLFKFFKILTLIKKLNGIFIFIMGFFITTGIAHTNFINFIVNNVLVFIYSKESLTAKIMLWIIIFIILLLLSYLINLTCYSIRKSLNEKEKSNLKKGQKQLGKNQKSIKEELSLVEEHIVNKEKKKVNSQDDLSEEELQEVDKEVEEDLEGLEDTEKDE